MEKASFKSYQASLGLPKSRGIDIPLSDLQCPEEFGVGGCYTRPTERARHIQDRLS